MIRDKNYVRTKTKNKYQETNTFAQYVQTEETILNCEKTCTADMSSSLYSYPL